MSRRFVRLTVPLALAALLIGGCFGPSSTPTPAATALPTGSAGASHTARPTPASTARPTPASTPRSTPSPPVTPTPTARPTSPPSTATPAPTFVTHTVAQGESLSLIARLYDTTWQSLVFWNQDRYPAFDPAESGYDPNRLDVGWRLLVWPGVVVDYDPPLPTPTTTPRPATPTPAPSGASTAVWNGSRSSARVALTFDMGGRTEPAVAIMSWLRDHDTAATIFMTGSSVDTTDAAREVISIINAHPGLFDLGNHTYSHPHVAELSAAQVADELRQAEAALGRYADQSPRPIFRPPFGEWDGDVLAGAGSAGYRWTVLWDVDTIDWKPIGEGGPSADQMVAKVLDRAQGGSIVLMHLGGYETLAALPEIVAGLHTRGYTLVTLHDLLGP